MTRLQGARTLVRLPRRVRGPWNRPSDNAARPHPRRSARSVGRPCSGWSRWSSTPTPIRVSLASTPCTMSALAITDDSNETAGETTVTHEAARRRTARHRADPTSAASGKGMIVGTVMQQLLEYPDLARVHPLVRPAARLRSLPLRRPETKCRSRSCTGASPPKACADRQHPRGAHGLQRELAQPRASMAADDRPSVRQGHRRVHRHRAGALSGRGQRTAGGGARPAGRARRTHWKQSVPIASWLYALGVAASPCIMPAS